MAYNVVCHGLSGVRLAATILWTKHLPRCKAWVITPPMGVARGGPGARFPSPAWFPQLQGRRGGRPRRGASLCATFGPDAAPPHLARPFGQYARGAPLYATFWPGLHAIQRCMPWIGNEPAKQQNLRRRVEFLKACARHPPPGQGVGPRGATPGRIPVRAQYLSRPGFLTVGVVAFDPARGARGVVAYPATAPHPFFAGSTCRRCEDEI